MHAIRAIRRGSFFAAAVLVVATIVCARPANLAGTKAGSGKILAQRLVESTKLSHAELDEVSISTETSRGCVGIASTDKTDIGEKCEKEDSEPMRTGQPFVESEGRSYDASVPLHDSSGRTIGTVGIGFKPSPVQTKPSAVREAKQIAGEMAAKIPSKASLFKR